MKLSSDTIKILKNYVTINPSIYVKAGNELCTIKRDQILAKATVEETFEQDFGIYYLGRFLQTLELFDQPELGFKDKYILISDKNNKKAKYVLSEKETINFPDKMTVDMPKTDVFLKLSRTDLENTAKALAVMKLTDIALVGNEKDISIQAFSLKNPLSDKFTKKLGSTNRQFMAIFNPLHLNFIPDDYDVDISSEGIARFKGTKVEYYIPVNEKSNFGDNNE